MKAADQHIYEMDSSDKGSGNNSSSSDCIENDDIIYMNEQSHATNTCKPTNVKEFGVQTCILNVKTFRSVKTQTDSITLSNAAECPTSATDHSDHNILDEHNYCKPSLQSPPAFPEEIEMQESEADHTHTFSADGSTVTNTQSQPRCTAMMTTWMVILLKMILCILLPAVMTTLTVKMKMFTQLKGKNGLFLKVNLINFLYSVLNVETLLQVKQNIAKAA